MKGEPARLKFRLKVIVLIIFFILIFFILNILAILTNPILNQQRLIRGVAKYTHCILGQIFIYKHFNCQCRVTYFVIKIHSLNRDIMTFQSSKKFLAIAN